MRATESTGASLKHGAATVLGSWPIIVIDFSIESVYKIALAVPVIGGAFMVAVLFDLDFGSLVGPGASSAFDVVFNALAAAPSAFGAFLAAVGLVGVGGLGLMYVVKTGTLAVLVRRDAETASSITIKELVESSRRYARRASVLGVGLGVAYLAIGWGFVVLSARGLDAVAASNWPGAWPALVLAVTAAAVLVAACAGLACDLLRVILVSDDCTLAGAARRLPGFLGRDGRHVVLVCAVMSLGSATAMAIGLMVTASLALVAWVPVVGLIVVPLEAAAWAARGLILQTMSLSTMAAYARRYRQAREGSAAVGATPPDGQHA
jgi:hypothetical protein